MRGADQELGSAHSPMFAGGGEMGVLMRSIDWAQTPLGPTERWPQSLRTSVSVCLHSRFPILLWWGPELVMLYNDAYRPILGATKHPQAMGRAGHAVWPEVWQIIGPMLEGVLTRGEATWSDDQLLLLDRNGYVEECYFTFSYSPIHDEAGKVGGIFCAVTETTERVLGERRLKTLRNLGEPSLAEAKTAEQACRTAAATLAENPHDFPFALIYLLDADGRQARLAETVNLAAGTRASPRVVTIEGEDDPWNFRQIVATSQSRIHEDLEAHFGRLAASPWAGELAKRALVLPLAKPGVQDVPAGFMVTGISPRLALNDAYRSFLELAAQQLATAIANAQVYEQERRRAEVLAELDRAKTAFFSNISHEFRTPEDGLSVFFTDITERKRAEQALRESEARYRQLANAMPQLVWSSDSDGVVDYYNSRAAEYAGIERSAAGTWEWQPVLHPDDIQPTLAAWRHAAQHGQLYAFEHRMQMQDGSYRWHLSRAIPARDWNGQIVKWFGTATDIHEQHQAMQDARCLADIGEVIRLTADTQAMLVQVTQIVGEHLLVRRCMVIEFDHARDLGVIRWQYCRGVPPLASEYRLTEYSAVIQAESDTTRTIVNADSQINPRTAAIYEATYRPYGERAYVAVPILRDGVRNATLWVSDDVPRQWEAREVQLLETVAERVWLAIEKLRAEQALRANEERLQILYQREQQARAQAESASRLKDEFLATVSHELRTPLTSILGYAQLLQSRKRDEAYVARTIEKIVRSAKAQSQLIDDLLDVARIVTGKLRIEPRPIDLGDVIHPAIEALRPAIDAKGIRLDSDLSTRARTIVGDPNRLQQVVWNLLSNAVKFTPAGGTVRVRLEARDGYAHLIVADTGQGISAEFLPYVFDRFRQAESTSTRAYGGLGLGLAIVRHLVEMHGGTVLVESSGLGQGATFTVRLPMAVGHAGPMAGSPGSSNDAGLCPPALAGLRVLVVDDQPDIVDLIREMLAPCGAVIQTTTAARDGLAILRAWQPDVLVSDIAMPGEDGYWLIRNLRALAPEDGGGIPAVALTAYVRVEDRMQVLAAGFQAYVPKPIDPAELLDAVARLAITPAADEP